MRSVTAADSGRFRPACKRGRIRKVTHSISRPFGPTLLLLRRRRGRSTRGEVRMASRIEDYGIIGNMRTSALVSRAGSIDWFCAPNFDSDACFAGLVGYDEHGHWSIRPAASVREVHQRYDS